MAGKELRDERAVEPKDKSELEKNVMALMQANADLAKAIGQISDTQKTNHAELLKYIKAGRF